VAEVVDCPISEASCLLGGGWEEVESGIVRRKEKEKAVRSE